jgi:hypothetical protein
MTYIAAMFQGAISRDIEWCMHLRVTGRTLGQLRAMNIFVTTRTFRQDILIFYLVRTINMKSLVTFHAVYLVSAARGSYEIVKVGMTSPALLRFHGPNTLGIYGGKVGVGTGFTRGGGRTSEKAQNKQYDYQPSPSP